MALNVLLNNGVVGITRAQNPGGGSYSFDEQYSASGDCCAVRLGEFPLGKKHRIKFELQPDEYSVLFLLQELTEEDLAEMERCAAALNGEAAQMQNLGPEDTPTHVAVFSFAEKLFISCGTKDKVFKSMVRMVHKVRNIHLNKHELKFDLWAKVENPFHLKVEGAALCIADAVGPNSHIFARQYIVYGEDIQTRNYRCSFNIPTQMLSDYSAGENSAVSMGANACKLMFEIEGMPAFYRIFDKPKKYKKHFFKHNMRDTWVPKAATYDNNMALHIRGRLSGTYVLFKRVMEPVEYTHWFRFMESKPVSATLFVIGAMLNHFPVIKKTALFYEKHAEKAEEGTFEFCCRCSESKRTKCYFVIDKNALDYQRIKQDPRVIRKFSLRYYWRLYNANYFIAPEAPTHITLFDSNNKYLRWNLIRHPFVFLQHGIIYLKPMEKRSTFAKGRGGQFSYIVVSSEKEKAVVSEMFGVSFRRILKTGLLMLDKCEYKHINQNSPDKITVMLTWKPYEKYLDNFEDSTYYQDVCQVYNMLLKYVDRSQINIVPHPHTRDFMLTTDLHDLVWTKPISEALVETKLLITDYSSVCWNAFYQGGGVVFYQPDLAEYENYVGKLIPHDNEYVGFRVFNINDLEAVIAQGITDSHIQLQHFRTEEYERRYATVNEFHDGKNGERLYSALKGIGYI